MHTSIFSKVFQSFFYWTWSRTKLSEQDKEISLLKETLQNERFFFVVNLLNFEIEQVHGLQKYLGYSERDFTYKKYWNHLIHPGKEALKLLARHMYDALCKGKYKITIDFFSI